MYNAPVRATIRTDRIRHNVQVIRKQAHPAALMAVLKADAYGHGVRRIAPLLSDAGVRAFAVARVHEALALRDLGIEGFILVLAPPTRDQLPAYVAHNLHASVTSPDVARLLLHSDLSASLSVHVNVDTGMHRLGVAWGAVPTWWTRLHKAPMLSVTGVYTHLATADAPAHPLNARQLQRFANTVAALRPSPRAVHVANTDALTHLPDRLPTDAQYVRAGLGLYGLTSTPPDARYQRPTDLQMALSLEAQVVHLHTVPEGETVSYGARWTAPSDTRVATIGIGYGDGYPRAASGSAYVRVHGTLRPMVGSVCMDLCMVDLGSPNSTLAKRTAVGDAAILFDDTAPTLHDLARWSQTIPYELCCQLAPRVPRRYQDPTPATAENGTI
ncbi:MAG: alanine racemase [Longimonas sp.]|uniref:alanine racemase n=1 Tax=Longimonas sp. TaxID=2039626 RepID=UPI003976B5A5